jgi:hypothetical protein
MPAGVPRFCSGGVTAAGRALDREGTVATNTRCFLFTRDPSTSDTTTHYIFGSKEL